MNEPSTKSVFAAFREALGFNLKQVGHAGELIGLEPKAARTRHSGDQPLTKTELLAMSAVIAGLAPYRSSIHSSLASLAARHEKMNKSEMNRSRLLAKSAETAGLPPYRPDLHSSLESVASLIGAALDVGPVATAARADRGESTGGTGENMDGAGESQGS